MPLPDLVRPTDDFNVWFNATNNLISHVSNTSAYILVAQNATPQVASGNISVSGTATLGTVAATYLTVSANAVITGNVTVQNRLSVNNDATFLNSVAVTQNMAVTGNISAQIVTVAGYTNTLALYTNTLSVIGTATVTGNLNVTSRTTVANLNATAITTSGNVIVGGTLNATGNVTTSGSINAVNVTLTGNLSANVYTGNGVSLTSLNATSLTSGTVPVARLPLATSSATGAVSAGPSTQSFGGDKEFIGAMTLQSTLSVNSEATFGNTLNALSSVRVAGTLNALGLVTVAANANFATGALFVDAVNTRVGVGGNTTPAHALRVEGTTSLNGAVNALGTLAVTGAVNALSTLGVTGAVNALGTLGVSGTLNALSALGVSGTLSALGQLSVAANAAFDTNVLFVDAVNNRVGVNRIPVNELDVNGTVNATSFKGAGTDVTALNATALTTGTVPLARLSSASVSANGVMDTTTQAFAGDKTFQNTVSFSNTVTVASNAAFDTNVLFVDAVNNRVGINNSTPGVALEITGAVRATEFIGTVTTDPSGAIGNSTLPYSKLINNTAARVLMFNASQVATATTISGDITIDSTGVTTIGTGKVTSAMILDNTIVDADISTSAAIAYSKLATATAGRLLMTNSLGRVEALPMSGDVTITSAGVTAIDTGKVTNTMLAGSIDKTKITGTAITAADTGTVTSAMILNGTILDADISATAAIAYAKLALTGSITNGDLAGSIAKTKISGTAITAADTGTVTGTMIASGTIANTNISPSAEIQYSKLALAGSITNADLAGSIDPTKITGTAITTLSTTGSNAGALSTGTVPLARLSSASVSANGVVNTGAQAFAGDKTFQNAASFSNTVSITGAFTTSNTLGVTGAATFSNTLTVTGTISSSNTVTATGNLVASSQLLVSANAAFDTNVLFVDAVNNRVGVNRIPANTVDVNGTVNATAFAGDGSALTSLSATAISDGTVSALRLPQAATAVSGIMNVTAQTFGGEKTFQNAISFSNTVTVAGNVTVDGGVLFVDTATNKIGINNTAPAYALDVNGTIRAAAFIGNLVPNPDLFVDDGLAYTKLKNNTAARVLMFNASGIATATTISGDITVGSTGATTIAAGAVTSGKIANETITNDDINNSADISLSKLANITAGRLLMGNSVNRPEALVMGGDVTIDSSGQTTIASQAITNAKIKNGAGIEISKLAASTISGVSLGGTLNTLTFSTAGDGASGGTTYTGATSRTISYNSVGAAAANQQMFIGTTAILINRAAAAQTLSDVSIGGNALTATTLASARTLTIGSTGKTFNGSGDVGWSLDDIGVPSKTGAGATGTNWNISILGNAGGNAETATKLATARNLTIGSTAKAFDGSAALSWSLTEIGASALDGTGATGTNWNISILGNAATATKLATARNLTIGSTAKAFDGSAPLSWSLTEIGVPSLTGTGATGTWGIDISGTAAVATSAGTATKLATPRNLQIGSTAKAFDGSAALSWSLTEIGAPALDGTGATGTWGIGISGTAATATKLATARNLQIGSTAKAFDGSAALSWSLAEIGAAAVSQGMYIGTTLFTINRAAAVQTLTGVSIDGNAATATAAGSSLGGTFFLPRTNAGGEGGQLSFARAIDNQYSWTIDSYGSDQYAVLRVFPEPAIFGQPSTVGVQLLVGATSWSTYSDERMKILGTPISNATSRLSTLRTVMGRFKTDSPSVERSFLIAQDVEQVFPELVRESQTETLKDVKNLSYQDLVPYLVASIKELSAEIETLRAQVQALSS